MFRGAWEDQPTDTFELGFVFDHDYEWVSNDSCVSHIQVILDKEHTCNISSMNYLGYNWYKFGDHVGSTCYNKRGEVFITSKDSILIDYTIDNLHSERHIFRGARIE